MSEQSAEYRYASNLAAALAQKHWPENTKWELLPDTLGVLAQIDNMTTLMDDQKREIERLREALGIVEAYLHVTANPSNELDIVRHALRNNN